MESFLFALNLVIVVGLCRLALIRENEEEKRKVEKETSDA